MGMTREEIRARRSATAVPTDIANLGKVHLRVLSLAESKAIGKRVKEKDLEYDTALIMACLCDENGTRLYGDQDAAEFEAEVDTPVGLDLGRACLRVNKIGTAEDLEKWKKEAAADAKN